jgi:hypothetical protein
MPWILRGAWSMVSTILPPNAHRRIQFIGSMDEIHAQIDLDQIPPGKTAFHFVSIKLMTY